MTGMMNRQCTADAPGRSSPCIIHVPLIFATIGARSPTEVFFRSFPQEECERVNDIVGTEVAGAVFGMLDQLAGDPRTKEGHSTQDQLLLNMSPK